MREKKSRNSRRWFLRPSSIVIHTVLLISVFLFLFPFFWMYSTSVKTDEELLDNEIFPHVLTFRPDSPYVRDVAEPARPMDVEPKRWDEILPTLRDTAHIELAKYQHAHGEIPSVHDVNTEAHLNSATDLLVAQSVAKMDRRLWTQSDSTLLTAYRGLLTDQTVGNALADSLGKLQLLAMQIRSLDLHVYNLLDNEQFASAWKVESGDAKLLKWGGSTLLSYHFGSSWDKPLVLRYDFTLPDGMRAEDLYKLSVGIRADNSWHRVYATLDMGGNEWKTKRCIYVAQNREMSLLFQPPTFDDQTIRPKIWTTLHKSGKAPLSQQTAHSPKDATLRLTIYPSSTLRANFGKMIQNYDRAFRAVPFWMYTLNSMLLVILCVAGSLFSAAFVAYAFARLNWPGRSVAFLILLATMMLPSQVTMVPGFLIWRQLHWYNTLNPIWVPAFFGSAFFIFLMTQHMRTIPRELEEAARLDGLNSVQSWYYMILPQVTPTLAAIAILSFMGSWNEFMGPLIYLRDQTRFPLSLGLYGLGLMRTVSTDPEDFNWTVVMAGNMLMTIPVIVVFFIFQRYFVRGMTLTGMKG
ncbi:MAG TPA: ABC transporter permease subunit [Tepidisphaeraceae bacterium]